MYKVRILDRDIFSASLHVAPPELFINAGYSFTADTLEFGIIEQNDTDESIRLAILWLGDLLFSLDIDKRAPFPLHTHRRKEPLKPFKLDNNFIRSLTQRDILMLRTTIQTNSPKRTGHLLITLPLLENIASATFTIQGTDDRNKHYKKNLIDSGLVSNLVSYLDEDRRVYCYGRL